ncbi:pectinesterase family protein [Isoptericola jiangsuensis]|uniref:pectinesterase family protein n=1 Tax=Isoptericola jiangsuensis TaxID=548579 RepID=UPI003AAB2BC9
MPRSIHVGDDADHAPSLTLALADPDVTEVVVHPGVHVEQVVVAPRRRPLLIRSASGDPRDTILSFDLRQGDRGADGLHLVQDCATLTIDADDVTLRDLTVRNTYDKRLGQDVPDSQALALRTHGTRLTVEGCHLLGRQDTLLLDTPSFAAVSHVHVRDCLIVGDVDFVYGRATALIEGGEIRSCGAGYVAAPSTVVENPRGLLFHGVTLTADDDVAPGSVHLARPWHPGGRPEAVGQALFVDCTVGPHVAADRWTDMGGYSWRDGARFGESGTRLAEGAVATSPEHDLPVSADVADHLTGWDAPPAPTGRLHVLSDSTASDYTPERAPRTGWGQVLAETSGRDVANHAVSGMSTTSLVAGGHLAAALEEVRPGDVVLVGFGHNDAKDDARHADPYREYPANLRRVLAGVRARRATPVLVTPVERRRFDGERSRGTHGPYPQVVRHLAAAEGVALVDLTRATRALWQAQGAEGSKESFLWLTRGQWPGYPDGEQDDTHLSDTGARAVAGIVVAALGDLGVLDPTGR